MQKLAVVAQCHACLPQRITPFISAHLTRGHMKFKFECGDWTVYRTLPGVFVVDYHDARGTSLGSFHQNMQIVRKRTLQALVDAQRNGIKYLLFTHGCSTSGPGKMSARSVIRSLMRSKVATPFIIRKHSIQHPSAFVAAIQQLQPHLTTATAMTFTIV